jgi:hypothetical protein
MGVLRIFEFRRALQAVRSAYYENLWQPAKNTTNALASEEMLNNQKRQQQES